MEAFQPYGHTIVSLAALVLLWSVMNPLSALVKEKAGTPSGAAPEPDYSTAAYRWYRAYSNLTETAPFFAIAVVSCIFAGASAFLVNLLASLFLISRIAVAYVHIRGIGKPNGGLRTMIFVIGWAIIIILSLMAMFAVLF